MPLQYCMIIIKINHTVGDEVGLLLRGSTPRHQGRAGSGRKGGRTSYGIRYGTYGIYGKYTRKIRTKYDKDTGKIRIDSVVLKLTEGVTDGRHREGVTDAVVTEKASPTRSSPRRRHRRGRHREGVTDGHRRSKGN
eukprot:1185005-Prorocentrum_minimum.AAC.5